MRFAVPITVCYVLSLLFRKYLYAIIIIYSLVHVYLTVY